MKTLYVLAVWVATWTVVLGQTTEPNCPWDWQDLHRWSDPATWAPDPVPHTGDKVVIPSNVNVLFDTNATLSTLTINAGGKLIWDNKDGLELNVHHILIRGEFHIGSRRCRFTQNARIRLHGKMDDPLTVEEHGFGRKFIGVAPGGTLELHGKKKTSWTKLAQTVKPPQDVPNAIIYDHSDTQTYLVGQERQSGLHAIIWNEDGSLMDFRVFKEYNSFPDFFKTIPKRKVIGMFAFGSTGIGNRNPDSNTFIGLLEPQITELGGSLINSTAKSDSYSFIGRMGFPDTVKEWSRRDGQVDVGPPGYLCLLDKKRSLDFQVSSSYAEKDQYFRVIHADLAYPVLTFTDEVVNWATGDKVVITSTDYDASQAEVKTIINCRDCSRRQVMVDGAFQHVHYGNFSYHVDERAEVGILSRGIVIEGVMEDECYFIHSNQSRLCRIFHEDMHGGHVRVVNGFKDVHIRGVELYHMGQQHRMGAYPLHFHMCDDVKGNYLQENTVHHSLSRCFTIHGTNYLDVSDNVCFEHYGHGLFVEDGVEQNNVVRGNLIANTKYGSLLLSDMDKDVCEIFERKYVTNCGDPSSFWITHPNNIFENNVAAGGVANGYMIVLADLPLGSSRAKYEALNMTHNPKHFPLHFKGNVAHSYINSGVWMDEKIATGTGIENKGITPENSILRTENEYDPHINGKPAWTQISYGTFYKNGRHNMWIKGGNVNVTQCTIADSQQGFSGGTTLFNSGTAVHKCIFIGETENKGVGKPSTKNRAYSTDRSCVGLPTDTLTAVELYQGPVFVQSCYFDQFLTKSWCPVDGESCKDNEKLTRYAGAISFKRSNTYPFMPSSYIVNNTFGYCDNENSTKHWVFQGTDDIEDWNWKDGNRAVFVTDRDGSVTGVPGATIVSDFKLYLGDECQKRPDWRLAACPYRYVNMELLSDSGSLSGDIKKNYPVTIRRDDAPYNESFSMRGEIRLEFTLRVDRSYLVDFNKSHADAAFPSTYKIFGYGVERGDEVRVGICQPKDVDNFTVRMDYPATIRKNASWVSSLALLDADTSGTAFFHDKANGILFFKMMSFDVDTNETQQCPDGKCWKATIVVNGGTLDRMRSCSRVDIPPFMGNTNAPKPDTPQKPPCPAKGSPEGLGAVDWNNLGFVVKEELSVTKHTFDEVAGKSSRVRVGCYSERMFASKYEETLGPRDQMDFVLSMSVDFCVNRCYYRGYTHAGLSRSRKCSCANMAAMLPASAEMKDDNSLCYLKCNGVTSDKCGGDNSMDVWFTGLGV